MTGVVLVVVLVSNGIVEATSTDVNGEQKSEKKSADYRITAQTVSHGMGEVGRAIHEVLVGEFDDIGKDVSKKGGVVTRVLPFIKKLPKLAGYLGAIGTIFSIITSFLPAGDSPEMIQMKKSFSEVNRKLDGITDSLQEAKNLVKEYSQKSAYLKAEHNIIRASQQLEICISKLMNVSCTNKGECEEQKMKIIADYKNIFNVRGDMEMILNGAIKDSVFGTALLNLISESSRCNINRIMSFQSAVAVLVTKGGSVAAFYDMITRSDFNMAADVRQFQSLMFDLEKSKDAIIFNCYKNIDRYIMSDSFDQRLKSTDASPEEQNKKILNFLSLKYPWIPFYIITSSFESPETVPDFWTNEKLQKDINAKNKVSKEKTKSYILIGSSDRIQNGLKKRGRMIKLLQEKDLFHYSMWFQPFTDRPDEMLLGYAKFDDLLRDQVRTILVVWKYSNVVVGYLDNKDVKQIKSSFHTAVHRNDLIAYFQCPHLANTCDKPAQIFTTIKKENSHMDKCFKDCSGHGKCFFLPHSKIMSCECDAYHYGENCDLDSSENNMALDLTEIMGISFKLPSLTDVYIQLKGAQTALQADLANVQKAIATLDNKLTDIFKTLSKELMTSFDWHGLITQYGQIVRDLKYYYHVLIETDTQCKNPEFLQSITTLCKNQKISITKEKQELARLILKPNALRRQLHQLNYLFLGRQDISLISHQSLLFQTMEKYRDKLCTFEYKKTLDRVYKQLLLLQFQGYVVWLHALKLIDLDSNFVVHRYQQNIQKQLIFFATKTCQIQIQNSVNFEDCTNGYYVYSGMKQDVRCKETFHLTKNTIGLFVSNVIKASSESSDTGLSAKQIIGSPDVYPTYGASNKSWSSCRSEKENPQFIEVAFKDPLFISHVSIFETFHGGAVWKIEGFFQDREWKILWETQRAKLADIQSSRIFNASITTDWSTSKLKVHIDCTISNMEVQLDAIEIKGIPVHGVCSWYDSLSCTPCACDGIGSLDQTCSSDGQCNCKPTYKGKKCNTRDCIMGPWTRWTSCQCGPGKTKTRSRVIQQEHYGEGEVCGALSATELCNIACVCGAEEWGDFCEHKNCLVSHWGNWVTCPHQYPDECGMPNPPTKYIYRYRHVTRRNTNHGKGCPGLQESKPCPLPKCIPSWQMPTF